MGDNISKTQFVQKVKVKTKNFAVDVIKFCKSIPKSSEGEIIKKQLIRCSTSVGANYRAACRARSRKEFYAKMCIVVEEADETLFWLEVIRDSNMNRNNKLAHLLKEAKELVSIVATARKTAGSKL